MKASKLIQKLAKAIEQNGDIDIEVRYEADACSSENIAVYAKDAHIIINCDGWKEEVRAISL